MRLQGKTAVITGTGSGIGRGLAARFAREGALVIAIDINSASGMETVAQITQAGHSAEFVQMDVADSAAVRNGMGDIAARHGVIDALITNAGVFPAAANIEETAEEDWDACTA